MQSCGSCYKIGKGLLMCEEKQKVEHLTNFQKIETSFIRSFFLSCEAVLVVTEYR